MDATVPIDEGVARFKNSWTLENHVDFRPLWTGALSTLEIAHSLELGGSNVFAGLSIKQTLSATRR